MSEAIAAVTAPNTVETLATHLKALGLGSVAEAFRSQPGVVGNLGGAVLLLGVGHDRNTALHLAETEAGTTLWRPMNNLGYGGEDFAALEAAGGARVG